MMNSELAIGRKVIVASLFKGDRPGTIVALTDLYEIPSNGSFPEKNADRWVEVEFADGSRSKHMAGMIDAA